MSIIKKCVILINKTYFTKIFTTKYSTKNLLQATGQKYVPKDNSLENRILTYVKVPLPVWDDNKSITIENYKPNSISNINNNSLLNLISVLSKFKHKDIQKCIKNLDLECRKRLSEMNENDIFLFLYNFVHTVPYYLKNLPFFSQAIHKMSFSIQHYSKFELIQLCFYTGLKKKTYESQNIIKQCLNRLNNPSIELTTEDVVIICNSAFKTSTKITQKKLLEIIKNRIFDELTILKDPPFFISIVKSLRHNYNYDEELLLTLSNTIFFNKTLEFYNFTGLSHILALYADALYYDSALLDAVNDKCLSYLRNTKKISLTEHLSKQLRLKDVCRYLWSLSYLGYEDLLDEDVSDFIIPILKDFIELHGVEDNIEELVGTLLSLWVIGYHPIDLLPIVLQKNALLKGKHRKSFTARLNLLLTCIEFERKEVFNTLNLTAGPMSAYTINAQVIRRPHLTILYKSMQNLSQKYNIGSVEYSSRIPHLNIVGITGYDRNKNIQLFVECVDHMTSIRYKQEYGPHGFMKLKIRLLKSFHKPVLVVDEEELRDLTQAEIDEFIGNKLKRLLS